MDFQKVEACCADTVIIVRYAVSRLSASKPMTGISILSFFSLCIPSFAAKEYIICYPAMDFPEVVRTLTAQVGRGWHRFGVYS